MGMVMEAAPYSGCSTALPAPGRLPSFAARIGLFLSLGKLRFYPILTLAL
jgi:hypothetical protein